jgi:hypothetical protein
MRKLGLCFKCGDMYMSGHQCSPKRLHMIEGRNDKMEEFLNVEEELEK